jgi:hypothetical protein
VRATAGEHLDIFVSDAGISKAGAIEDHTVEDCKTKASLRCLAKLSDLRVS